MFYTSGTTVDSSLTTKVFQFFETKCASIKNYDVEVYFSDLSDDGVKGWQEKDGDEFLIHIHDKIETTEELIKTIFHELVHCAQDIRGLKDNNEREDEAYHLEDVYYGEFVA